MRDSPMFTQVSSVQDRSEALLLRQRELMECIVWLVDTRRCGSMVSQLMSEEPAMMQGHDAHMLALLQDVLKQQKQQQEAVTAAEATQDDVPLPDLMHMEGAIPAAIVSAACAADGGGKGESDGEPGAALTPAESFPPPGPTTSSTTQGTAAGAKAMSCHRPPRLRPSRLGPGQCTALSKAGSAVLDGVASSSDSGPDLPPSILTGDGRPPQLAPFPAVPSPAADSAGPPGVPSLRPGPDLFLTSVEDSNASLPTAVPVENWATLMTDEASPQSQAHRLRTPLVHQWTRGDIDGILLGTRSDSTGSEPDTDEQKQQQHNQRLRQQQQLQQQHTQQHRQHQQQLQSGTADHRLAVSSTERPAPPRSSPFEQPGIASVAGHPGMYLLPIDDSTNITGTPPPSVSAEAEEEPYLAHHLQRQRLREHLKDVACQFAEAPSGLLEFAGQSKDVVLSPMDTCDCDSMEMQKLVAEHERRNQEQSPGPSGL